MPDETFVELLSYIESSINSISRLFKILITNLSSGDMITDRLKNIEEMLLQHNRVLTEVRDSIEFRNWNANHTVIPSPSCISLSSSDGFILDP